MIKALGFLFAAVGLLYFLFYPFLKRSVDRNKLFKWFFIAYGVSILITTAGSYLFKNESPDSFKEGVELAKSKREIAEKIGEFKSVKFNKRDLPRDEDNPADLKFKLEGSKGILSVETRVAKDSDGNWYLVRIKEDSFVRKY